MEIENNLLNRLIVILFKNKQEGCLIVLKTWKEQT